jgi:UDP-N-acetylmuramoyl-tripeptide--D-alanyl-D-alanine ligase
MKNLLKKAVLRVLKFLAKVKLNRMKAKIIGVTGSVGKTTCKDAIFDVLATKYRVLKNEKSYNSEFGLLLTILHQESGFSSAGQWMKTLLRGFIRAFFVRDRYDFLVLEMGVDKPGDMDFLTSVVKPDYALITAIKPVHMAEGQFSSLDEIYNEKKKIFENMKPGGVRLVNMDDEYIKKFTDTRPVPTGRTIMLLYALKMLSKRQMVLSLILHIKKTLCILKPSFSESTGFR